MIERAAKGSSSSFDHVFQASQLFRKCAAHAWELKRRGVTLMLF